MKNIHKLLALATVVAVITSCGKDDPILEDDISAIIGADITVDIESSVTLDASASLGNLVSFEWNVMAPDGSMVTLENGTTATPWFIATSAGNYTAEVTVSTALSSSKAMSTITVESPSYKVADQMGRPAINTVFNFFGDAATKNGYNMTLPSQGSSNAQSFTGILDALQTYIFLDPNEFENILGIGNAALSGVLAVDALGSDKNLATAYGSLNGRALADDVIDVTLILAFDDQSAAGADNQVKAGVSTDNVSVNDKTFSNTFPYLADPH